MRNFSVASIVFVLLLGVSGRASADVPITLDAAVASALQQNPSYRYATAAVDAATAKVRAVRAASGPSGSLSDIESVVDPVARLQTPFGTLPFAPNAVNIPSVTFSYTLSDGGLSAARTGAAIADLARVQGLRYASERDTAATTTTAFYALALAQSRVRSSLYAIDAARREVKDAQLRFDHGVAARADVLEAQTHLAATELSTLDAKNDVLHASNRLAAVMHASMAQRYVALIPLPSNKDIPSADVVLASALARRGELRAANAAVAAARAAVATAKAARAPSITTTLGDGNVQPAVEPGFHNQIAFGISGVWRFFDGGSHRADIAAAEAAVAQAQDDVEKKRTEIELEIRNDATDVETARARVTAADALGRFAHENARVADLRYHGGIGTILEYQNALAQRMDADATVDAAKIDLAARIATFTYAALLP